MNHKNSIKLEFGRNCRDLSKDICATRQTTATTSFPMSNQATPEITSLIGTKLVYGRCKTGEGQV